ncbi:MAG: hypothetical protein HUU47_02880 [Bacteroidetes bacterium]|nr:hypothetical protein [Bacteroidota bacterium]
MKNLLLKSLIVTTIISCCIEQSFSQTFKKGSLYISLTEGSTNATFTTIKNNTNRYKNQNIIDLGGERDPLIIEYGITSKTGISITMGNDIFTINPQNHYGNTFKETGETKVKTSEFTIDFNYHLYNTKKIDISTFVSLGKFSLEFKGTESDFNYKYIANGGIMRLGGRTKYYFSKRMGVMAMLSTFSGNCSPINVKETNIAKDFNTNLTGFSTEFGLCFRFF